MMFTFILPAWKGKFLRDAVTSILNQNYKDFELVVVDDCSPDDIMGIIESFSDKRVRYYRNEKNIGGYNLVRQWNHCLEYATGNYVILATDDDVYEPDFLVRMSELIEKYPNVDLLRSRILQVDSDNNIINIDTCYKEFLTHNEFIYHILHGMKGGIPQYVFKTSAIRAKGGFLDFPLAWGADDATAIMMSDNGVATTQDHLVRFRWSNVNISNNQKTMPIKIKSRLLFYHWLVENHKAIEPMDEMTTFLHKNIDDYLTTYNKTALIGNIRSLPMKLKLRCLKEVCSDNTMAKRDKMSVIYHCFF